MNSQLQAILHDLYARVKKLEDELAELRKAQK
jgi:hypothetical protein